MSSISGIPVAGTVDAAGRIEWRGGRPDPLTGAELRRAARSAATLRRRLMLMMDEAGGRPVATIEAYVWCGGWPRPDVDRALAALRDAGILASGGRPDGRTYWRLADGPAEVGG